MAVIAHATALSSEDISPFVHCVALARASGAEICSVHAGSDPTAVARIPVADDLLAQWGAQGHIDHRRIVHRHSDDPVDTTLDALRIVNPDLVVTGPRHREGLMRFLHDSRANAISEGSAVPTLVVPAHARPFVKDGQVQISRIVVPIGDEEAAQLSCEAAKWFIRWTNVRGGELILLHVGKATAPTFLPDLPNDWQLVRVNALGPVEEAINDEAQTADLIVMATHGRDSIVDVLMGSRTERVFHRAPCPVLRCP